MFNSIERPLHPDQSDKIPFFLQLNRSIGRDTLTQNSLHTLHFIAKTYFKPQIRFRTSSTLLLSKWSLNTFSCHENETAKIEHLVFANGEEEKKQRRKRRKIKLFYQKHS